VIKPRLNFGTGSQDLPPRHFALKIRGQKVKAGKTINLPTPRVDPKELLEVEQEYLRRYFRSKQEITPVTADVRPPAVLSREKEITQALSLSADQPAGTPAITGTPFC
jgi:hypothetical protein